MIEMIPLVVFTVCGGLSAGALLCMAFCRPSCAAASESAASALPREAPARRVSLSTKSSSFFFLLCLILLGVGLLGTLAHLGQPLRFANGLSNPSSMIAQEGYWSIGLGVALVVAIVLSRKQKVPQAVKVVLAVLATGLMIVTSLAYFMAAGVPLWNGAATFLVFIVGDVAMGCALCAVLLERSRARLLDATALFAALMLLVSAALWSQSCVAHTAASMVPWIIVSMLLAGAVPLAVRAATAKGLMGSSTAATIMLVASVAGVTVMRMGFFLAVA